MSELVRSVGARLPAYIKRNLAPLVFDVMRYGEYRAAMRGRAADTRAIVERLRACHHEVKAPLILISQVQRSGGSLLSQLFDGHSQILAHPHELKIGHPLKSNWPPIRPEFSAEKQFKILFEPATIQMCRAGYSKGKKDTERRNFFFLPLAQRELFRAAMERGDRSDERHVLNSYFTSYFNAWLNMRTTIPAARYITGFVPGMSSDPANMERFWRAYPDGFLVSVIRSPLQWFPSARRLGDGTKLGDLERAAERWRASTEAALREQDRCGQRVILVHFDDLIANTAAVMRHVCERTGLEFEPSLLNPTFNGEPMGANTSFEKVTRGQVSSAPLRRDRHLSPEDRDYLTRHCMPHYEQAAARTIHVSRNAAASSDCAA